MGREADCEAAFSWRDGDRFTPGKALLESSELIFRGAQRVKVAFSTIASVSVDESTLVVTSTDGCSRWVLGPREALLWEKKITSPPTTLDKLGVSASSEVWELGALPDTLLADLDRVAPRARHRAGSWFADRVAGPIEGVLLISVTTQRDLEIIATISTAIADTAAVWILYPRGVRVVTENDVRRAGITAGLVDNKTAKITDTVTSLRFVRPKSARASARR